MREITIAQVRAHAAAKVAKAAVEASRIVARGVARWRKAAGLNKWTGAVRGDREAESEEEEENEEVEGEEEEEEEEEEEGSSEEDEEAEDEETAGDGGDVRSQQHEERGGGPDSKPRAPLRARPVRGRITH